MKKLKYIYVYEVNIGTEDEPNIVQNQHPCETVCTDEAFDASYLYAKAHALNGEVTVEEVEETHEPTDKERIAELEEALAMLLSGVTE